MNMKIIPVLVTFIAVTACTAGLQFNYEKVNDLDLDRIKQSEYVDIFGTPYQTTNMNVSGDKYQIAWYHYGVRPILVKAEIRNLLLEFKQEHLNGYIYASSIKNDKTRIDISKVDKIQVGTSTKNDVLTLLGRPYGKAHCPTQLNDFKDGCGRAKEVWGWMMFDVGKVIYNKKFAMVMFDENGKVIDIKATESE